MLESFSWLLGAANSCINQAAASSIMLIWSNTLSVLLASILVSPRVVKSFQDCRASLSSCRPKAPKRYLLQNSVSSDELRGHGIVQRDALNVVSSTAARGLLPALRPLGFHSVHGCCVNFLKARQWQEEEGLIFFITMAADLRASLCLQIPGVFVGLTHLCFVLSEE